jgi:hypothetical protein
MATTHSTTVRVALAGLGVVIATLVMLALGGTAHAAGTGYYYDPNLRGWVHESLELASYGDHNRKTIPLPVEVRCYDTNAEFDAAAAPGEPVGTDVRTVVAYYDHGNTINMRPTTCEQAHVFASGVITPTSAIAFEALLHEALHRQGIHSEYLAEEYAIASMFSAGKLVRYSSTLNKGGTPDYQNGRDVNYAGYLARGYSLAANRYRPPAYRVTLKDVEGAQSLG